MKTKILLLASVLFGAVLAIHSQPLMKTHVETGDLEATADGNDLAVCSCNDGVAGTPCGEVQALVDVPLAGNRVNVLTELH